VPVGCSRCQWVTADDRSFPPVLARTWHAAWMQTTGTLHAVKWRSLRVNLASSTWPPHGLHMASKRFSYALYGCTSSTLDATR
jgi:hypothetical protein